MESQNNCYLVNVIIILVTKKMRSISVVRKQTPPSCFRTLTEDGFGHVVQQLNSLVFQVYGKLTLIGDIPSSIPDTG